MKRILPRAWSTDPFFRQIDELEGIPVINIHLWFDRKRLGSGFFHGIGMDWHCWIGWVDDWMIGWWMEMGNKNSYLDSPLCTTAISDATSQLCRNHCGESLLWWSVRGHLVFTCFNHRLLHGLLKSQAAECESPLLQPQSVAVRLRGYEHLLHLAARNGSSLVMRGRASGNGHIDVFCRWKKSCTSWSVVTGFSHDCIIYRVSTIQGSVGFLPSTLWNFWHQKMSEKCVVPKAKSTKMRTCRW